MADQQAGWYQDPSGDATKLRYWDGQQWTNDFTDAPSAAQAAAQTQQSSVPEQTQVQPEPASYTGAPAQAEPQTTAPAEQPQPVADASYGASTQAPSQTPVQPTQAAQPVTPVQPAQSMGTQPAPAQPVTPVQPAQPMGAQPTPAQPTQPYAQSVPQPAPVQPMNQGQAPMYAPTPGYQPKKKSKAPLIIGIIVAAVVVIGIIIGVVIATSSPAPSTGSDTIADITVPDTGIDTDNSDDATEISGDVTGEVGVEYETMWFTFTVDSMETASTYADYTAAEGNVLLIAHVTETNTSGSSQPFGTFDWLVDDDSLLEYIYPLDPLNDAMMPSSFTLEDGETASYDVVIEYPADLASPFFMYIEADDQGTTYTTFKIPIK